MPIFGEQDGQWHMNIASIDSMFRLGQLIHNIIEAANSQHLLQFRTNIIRIFSQ